jgi:hypothetical protein
MVSGITKNVYAFRRIVQSTAEEEAERTITRVEGALFDTLKGLWDEHDPYREFPETPEGWSEYGAASGSRAVIATIAKDFDLEEQLVEHDADARRYM